jgi:hypothetical protein
MKTSGVPAVTSGWHVAGVVVFWTGTSKRAGLRVRTASVSQLGCSCRGTLVGCGGATLPISGSDRSTAHRAAIFDRFRSGSYVIALASMSGGQHVALQHGLYTVIFYTICLQDESTVLAK